MESETESKFAQKASTSYLKGQNLNISDNKRESHFIQLRKDGRNKIYNMKRGITQDRRNCAECSSKLLSEEILDSEQLQKFPDRAEMNKYNVVQKVVPYLEVPQFQQLAVETLNKLLNHEEMIDKLINNGWDVKLFNLAANHQFTAQVSSAIVIITSKYTHIKKLVEERKLLQIVLWLRKQNQEQTQKNAISILANVLDEEQLGIYQQLDKLNGNWLNEFLSVQYPETEAFLLRTLCEKYKNEISS